MCPTPPLLRGYETGSLKVAKSTTGRPNEETLMDNEESVIDHFIENPHSSTQQAAKALEMKKWNVWRILKGNKLHPFHFQRVQALNPNDFQPRVEFAHWYLDKIHNDNRLASHVLYTNEASFNQDLIFNNRNMHVGQKSNPHRTVSLRRQNRFNVNVWAGIIGDHIIGPYLLPLLLTGAKYLVFLLEVLPVYLRMPQ